MISGIFRSSGELRCYAILCAIFDREFSTYKQVVIDFILAHNGGGGGRVSTGAWKGKRVEEGKDIDK